MYQVHSNVEGKNFGETESTNCWKGNKDMMLEKK